MIWGFLMCIAIAIISYNIMAHFGFMVWLLLTAIIFGSVGIVQMVTAVTKAQK